MIYSKKESLELMERLKQLGGKIEFDYTPLDIGDIQKEGEGDTRTTWKFIKNIVDFTDKKVIVIGACCGFITDKILREGNASEIWAVEISPIKCDVIRLIIDFNNPDTSSKVHIFNGDWIDFQPPIIKEQWLVVALNVTHHFREKNFNLSDKVGGRIFKEQALNKMFQMPVSCLIFEAIGEDVSLIRRLKPDTDKYREWISPARPSRKIVHIMYEN